MNDSWRGIHQRPQEFTLNPQCQLAQRLVFCGAGRNPNSVLYRDSSLYGNHGTLTNMGVPATATSGWAWDNWLGRWALRFDGIDDKVVCPALPNAGSPYTVSAWVKRNAVVDDFEFVWQSGAYTAGLFVYENGTVRYGDATAGFSTWATLWTDKTQWHHVAITVANPNYGLAPANLYFDDVNKGLGDTSTTYADGIFSALKLGCFSNSTRFLSFCLSDFLVLKRVLSASEISVLADPSNVMLSGLLLPPRRRLFAVAAAAVTSSRRRRLLCGV